MQRSRTTLIAGSVVASAIAIAALGSASCGGNSCGLGLLRRLSIPSGAVSATPQFFDVDLSASDVQQVDLDSLVIAGQAGHVDAFLTTTDCTTLFAGNYTGSSTSPLCTIYIGPVAAGGVSGRVTLSHGRYRVLAQPWTTNVGATRFGFEVGIWGQDCSMVGLSPGAGF